MNDSAVKILVVEDESVVAMDLRKILGGLGYRVTDAVGTGLEAIESVGRDRPDLVLMDVRLRGDLDGIQTAAKIRASDVPVIYLTAYSEQGTLDRASQTEPYGYLLKPFDERELQVAVELGLHRHRAQKDREALVHEQAARAALADELRWARFLADAAPRLSSLDEVKTVKALAELAVEALADWAAVHVADDQGIATVTTAGAHGSLGGLVRRHPPSDTAREGARDARRVIAANEPILIRDVRDATLHEVALDAEHLRVLRALGVRSLVCVPLAVRGAPWGALTLGRGSARAPFDDRDLARALELAGRAAFAIDNARLFARVQSTNEELSRAVHFSEMFIGILGHDLRNPLSSIITGAGLVLRRKHGDEVSKPVERIMSSATRMGRMIDQILDFTRIRLGAGLPLEPRRTDLVEVFRAAIEELGAGTKLDIQVEHRGDTFGRWDGDRLGQLASNLVSNAIRHGSGGTAVSIDGSADDRVIVEVRNEGAISADILQSVFEPLATTGTSVTKRAGSSGLGLGLYISQKIVTAHGGEISCSTEVPDCTRFRVELPRDVSLGGSR